MRSRNDVCSTKHLKAIDNLIRPLIHPPEKVFGPYIKPGMHVMDIGCGGGFASLAFVRMVGPGGKVVAADLQQEMLDIVSARARAAAVPEGILHFHKCAKDSIGSAGRFDFINAMMMVHETPDQAAFFREVHTLLKDGGLLLFCEPKGHVTKTDFEKEVGLALAAGLCEQGRPRVAICHAALLVR